MVSRKYSFVFRSCLSLVLAFFVAFSLFSIKSHVAEFYGSGTAGHAVYYALFVFVMLLEVCLLLDFILGSLED